MKNKTIEFFINLNNINFLGIQFSNTPHSIFSTLLSNFNFLKIFIILLLFLFLVIHLFLHCKYFKIYLDILFFIN